jgi:hypothetical protein
VPTVWNCALSAADSNPGVDAWKEVTSWARQLEGLAHSRRQALAAFRLHRHGEAEMLDVGYRR